MGTPTGLPGGCSDERLLLLSWIAFLREAVLRKLEGLDEQQARWTPRAGLLPLLGIVHHLTQVEWRWIDGGYGGAVVSRDPDELVPPASLTVDDAVSRYRRRAQETHARVVIEDLRAPCAIRPEVDLRWVLLHLVNETARHAGHADATRELLDGSTGL